MELKIGKYIGGDQNIIDSITDGAVSSLQFKETLDSGYKDITSVETWMTVGLSSHDYLFCRNQSSLWLLSNPFSGLSQTNKVITSKQFLVDKSDRDTVLTSDEQFKHWSTFVVQSKHCREKRWGLSKNYASYILNTSDSFDLAKTTNSLSDDYKEYGIESNALDGMDGLIDWIQGTSGYSGSGLPSKSYWSQELEDKLVGFITNGY
jgi:hypothetical protein